MTDLTDTDAVAHRRYGRALADCTFDQLGAILADVAAAHARTSALADRIVTLTTTTTRPVRVRVGGNRYHPVVPAGAVYVGRPGPYLPGSPYGNRHPATGKTCRVCGVVHDRAEAVAAYRADLDLWTPEQHAQARRELDGRNLACWCALDLACHADVLLEWLAAS